MNKETTLNLGLHNLQPEHSGTPIDKLTENKEFDVSFHLRSKKADKDFESEELHEFLDIPSVERVYRGYNDLKKDFGAEANAVTKLVKFVKDKGLKLVESSATDGLVSVKGDVDAFKKALGCTFNHYRNEVSKAEYSIAHGEIHLPEDIIDHIGAITGLHPGVKKARRDNNTPAEPETGGKKEAPAERFLGYTPQEIESAYNFPSGTGSGQTIGLVELGGTYKQSDLDTYFERFNITPPSIEIMGDIPGESAQDDYEVTLDIELAVSLAPEAHFVIYYGKSLIDAIKLALSDTKNKPDILSISWAGSEFNYSQQELIEMNHLLLQAGIMGITVVVASGDQGAYNLKSYLNVNVPAASPYALGCGGTSLYKNGYEAVWNELDKKLGATGGGFSYKYSIPSYQRADVLQYNETSHSPGYSSEARAVPDISANADSITGYQIVLNGNTFPGGGTSAATPVWAALVARLNENLGFNVGYLNKVLYTLANEGGLKPVAGNEDGSGIGNNGYYSGSDSWNPCTGLGVPNGEVLLEAIHRLSGK
jgi:subtilase family serine protease